MTVVSDRIARVLTDLGLLELQSLIYQRLLTGKNYKLKSYGISGQIVGLISSFISNRRLQEVLDGKPSQEYLINTGVPQGHILGPTLFLLYINDLPDNVICNIAMLMILLCTLNVIRHLICDNN